jgi:hypothetical protein
MLTKATLIAMAAFWSPAGAAELQSYRVTVLEQTRYDITVDANEESAARTLALLEARPNLEIWQSGLETFTASDIGACA